jgi:tetratricopeptide (TPR) repeat protein
VAYDFYDSYQLSLIGAVAAREGDLSAAISLVERAVTYELKNGYYIVQAANLYPQKGNRDKARKYLETAIVVAPENSDTWQNLARFYKSAGQIREAELTVTNGLVHCPDSPSLVFVRGQNKVAADRLEDALPDFPKAAAALNDDASPSFELARVYFRLDRIPEALAALQKALIAEPEYPPALTSLAFYYVSTCDEPNAQKWMQKVKGQPRVKPQDRLDLDWAFQQQFGHAPY